MQIRKDACGPMMLMTVVGVTIEYIERKHAMQSRGVNDAKGCMAADLRLTG